MLSTRGAHVIHDIQSRHVIYNIHVMGDQWQGQSFT